MKLTTAIYNETELQTTTHPGRVDTLTARLSERRISPDVIEAFGIQGYGTGWLYTAPNGAQRWKNADPDGKPKYRWEGEKRANLLYDRNNLTSEVNLASGVIWYCTEFDFFAMQSAGIYNVMAQFLAETSVPVDLADSMQALGVLVCQIAPDRDKTGQQWAQKVTDALTPAGIKVVIRELPAPIQDKHGYDLGEAWRTYTEPLPFSAWLSFLPITKLKPKQVETITEPPAYSVQDDSKIPEIYRRTVASALGLAWKFNRRGYSQLMRCIFHDDHEPSASLHFEYGLKCFACGWHLWKELGERLNLGRWVYNDEDPIIADEICLSEEAALEIIKRGSTTLVRLLSAAYRTGWQAGRVFTSKDVLTRLRLSDWTTREALKGINVVFCGDISLFLNTPQKAPKNKRGRPAKTYRLPSPTEINTALNVQALHYSPIDGTESAKTIRAKLYEKPIERRPGKYARKYLCGPLGIHPNTARSYDKHLKLTVIPNVFQEEITSPDDLPDQHTHAPEHLLANGKKFAPTKAGYERALKHAEKTGAKIEMVTRQANFYATPKA